MKTWAVIIEHTSPKAILTASFVLKHGFILLFQAPFAGYACGKTLVFILLFQALTLLVKAVRVGKLLLSRMPIETPYMLYFAGDCKQGQICTNSDPLEPLIQAHGLKIHSENIAPIWDLYMRCFLPLGDKSDDSYFVLLLPFARCQLVASLVDWWCCKNWVHKRS